MHFLADEDHRTIKERTSTHRVIPPEEPLEHNPHIEFSVALCFRTHPPYAPNKGQELVVRLRAERNTTSAEQREIDYCFIPR